MDENNTAGDDLKINKDLLSMTRKELLHSLKQTRGFLNYSARRLNTEKTLLSSLADKMRSRDLQDPELERNLKAVQEAAKMFEYINLAYEQMIMFAMVCFDEKADTDSNKMKKKKSKVVKHDIRDYLPSIHEIVTCNNNFAEEERGKQDIDSGTDG